MPLCRATVRPPRTVYLHREGGRFGPARVLLVFYPNDPFETAAAQRRAGRAHPFHELRRSYSVALLRGLPAMLRLRHEEPYYAAVDRKMWNDCAAHIDRIAAWCEAQGALLDVAYVPLKDELGEKEPVGYRRALAEFCRGRQLSFTD